MPRKSRAPGEPDFTDPACRAFRFTPTRIEAACRAVAEGAVPTDGSATGRVQWRDADVPGLFLRVTANGTGTFTLFYKRDGKPIRKAIGPVDVVGLAEAREAAGRLRYDRTAAAKVAPRKAEPADALTLDQVWQAYIAEAEAGTFTVKRPIRPNTARSYRGVWGASLFDHGGRPLPWVAENIEQLVKPLQATPYAANRALALLSLLYRFASQRGMWAGPNPVADALRQNRLARHEEKPRQRFLKEDERRRFRQACLEAGEPWGSLFVFAAETGLRKRALLGLRWAHVHAQRKRGRFVAAGAALVIPADIMKAGRSDHGVDLRPEALEALERRWAARPDGMADDQDGPVFSWPDGSPLSSSPYERAFHDICKAAQVKGLRPHDLRRDLGARLVAAGTPLPIVAKILGHSPASIAMLARTYAPVSDETARRYLLDTPSVPAAKRSTRKARA
jgi:integrase